MSCLSDKGMRGTEDRMDAARVERLRSFSPSIVALHSSEHILSVSVPVAASGSATKSSVPGSFPHACSTEALQTLTYKHACPSVRARIGHEISCREQPCWLAMASWCTEKRPGEVVDYLAFNGSTGRGHPQPAPCMRVL